MKNHFIFLLGVIILIITVWITTMAGINANKSAVENKSSVQIENSFANKRFD